MYLMAVLLGLISMLGYAAANVVSQPLARKLGSKQILFLRGLTIVPILLIASIPSYNHFKDIHSILFALLLGILGYLPLLAFTHGIKISRVGVIAPIAGSSPLITVLMAFVILSTPLKALQWLAVIIIVVANMAASINPKSLKDSNLVKLASGVPFGLLAAIGWGVFYFALIYPTRSLGPWFAAFLVELGVTIAAGIHLILAKEKPKYNKAFSPAMVGCGLAIVIGTVAFTVGVSRYNIGIVAALSNSMALASILLAAYFFKERLNTIEKVTAAAMILGVVLISI